MVKNLVGGLKNDRQHWTKQFENANIENPLAEVKSSLPVGIKNGGAAKHTLEKTHYELTFKGESMDRITPGDMLFALLVAAGLYLLVRHILSPKKDSKQRSADRHTTSHSSTRSGHRVQQQAQQKPRGGTFFVYWQTSTDIHDALLEAMDSGSYSAVLQQWQGVKYVQDKTHAQELRQLGRGLREPPSPEPGTEVLLGSLKDPGGQMHPDSDGRITAEHYEAADQGKRTLDVRIVPIKTIDEFDHRG